MLAGLRDKMAIPFNSGKERFKEKKISENDKFLGPGYYES